MGEGRGYWSDMSIGMRLRTIVGVFYVLGAVVVFLRAPLPGMALLVFPVLAMSVGIWFRGPPDTPFSQRTSALSHFLNHVWSAPRPAKTTLAVLLVVAVVSGLGWISTEKLRAEAAKPSLAERVSTATERAKTATTDKTKGWIATAKGWFSSGEEP
ncbi:MAG: hypothetical protein LJE62_10400 [Silicimonas sp.]|jgi:hypothetical protein|nr:hypothetical protein [Silicimonas sp.]